MVSGFLGTLTTEERTLLHLLNHQLPENNWEAPMELTQAGISVAFMFSENTSHVRLNDLNNKIASIRQVGMFLVLDSEDVCIHSQTKDGNVHNQFFNALHQHPCA